MDLNEAICVEVILKDDNTTGVGPHDDKVFLHTHESKWYDLADQAEHFLPVHNLYFPSILIDLEELKYFAFRYDEFLLVRPCKTSVNGMCNSSCLL